MPCLLSVCDCLGFVHTERELDVLHSETPPLGGRCYNTQAQVYYHKANGSRRRAQQTSHSHCNTASSHFFLHSYTPKPVPLLCSTHEQCLLLLTTDDNWYSWTVTLVISSALSPVLSSAQSAEKENNTGRKSSGSSN